MKQDLYPAFFSLSSPSGLSYSAFFPSFPSHLLFLNVLFKTFSFHWRFEVLLWHQKQQEISSGTGAGVHLVLNIGKWIHCCLLGNSPLVEQQGKSSEDCFKISLAHSFLVWSWSSSYLKKGSLLSYSEVRQKTGLDVILKTTGLREAQAFVGNSLLCQMLYKVGCHLCKLILLWTS